MRPGGRLAAAMEVLAEIEARKRPASDALRDWGLSHRFAGSGDRSAIGNLVFDALRWRSSSAWAMGADTPRALAFAAFARGWVDDVDALKALLNGDAHAPSPPDADETTRLASLATGGLGAAPAHVRGDYPEWLEPQLSRLFGEAAAEEGAALAARAPLDLRVNLQKADRAKAAKALSRVAPVEVPHLPTALRIAAGQGADRLPNITADAAYQRGVVEIQDAASQFAAILAGATGGMQVGDICAGGGGKALALAALMGNRGQIHAYDADRNRLKPIYDRIKRAGARNIQVHAPQGRAMGDGASGISAGLADFGGKLDLVFVDAPCTGTGVWRRRPDAKWRLTEANLESRIAEQAAILVAAAHLVKPGGRLVYATCSILPAENDEQVSAFLSRHGGFSAIPADQVTTETLGARDGPEFLNATQIGQYGLTMTPRLTGTDGFYVSVLVRRDDADQA
jgi:16S rRNA (cytosine967-C5)-methyltransferase